MATPPASLPRAGVPATAGDDDLDYLTRATLTRRPDAADAAALARGGRAFYYRPNADVDALVAAASGVLAREPGSSRALAIRATALAKKG